MSCNGYKNYETWVTRNWADNDECLCNHFEELAGEHQHSESALADALKEYHEETLLGENTVGLAHDLLQACLDDVDWYGWAQDLISELVTDHLHEGD